MEKLVVFLHNDWLAASAQETGYVLDYASLLSYLANPEEGRLLQEAFAYVSIDPRREHAMDEVLRALWDAGFLVRPKIGTIVGQSYTCDFGVETALDMARVAYEVRPDIIVLVTGDERFLPAVLELRTKGIRVEVAAFGQAISPSLRHRCSGFINLDALNGTHTESEYNYPTTCDTDSASHARADPIPPTKNEDLSIAP